MKIIFFYNSKSGALINSPQLIDTLVNRIKSYLSGNDQLDVYDVQNIEEEKFIDELGEKDGLRIFTAGGDGTVSTIINNVFDLKIPVGIIPLGTFNNFSKCLNISQDPEEAVDQLMKGKITEVDVGKVNGRIIINNSSVGIYPKLVTLREQSQVNLRINKFPAMFISFVKAIFLFPLIKVSLTSQGIERKVKTSFAMVSNNKYELNLFEIGERKSLTEGLLYVYLLRCGTRLCVIKVLLKALFNKLNREKDFELIPTESAELMINKNEVEVSSDGEVFNMRPPLNYTICHKSLRVIVPENYG